MSTDKYLKTVDTSYLTFGQKVWAASVAAALIGGSGLAAVVFTPEDTFEIKLEAPASVAVGELVILDVSETGADSYAYSVTPPVRCEVFEKGTKLATSLTASEYVFVVAAAKSGQVSIVEHTITVEDGVAPTPGPAAFALRLKQAVASVKDDSKEAHLAALANTFRTIASMVAAGVIKDPEEIIKATLNLNAEALGGAAAAWQPVRDAINVELSARAAAGTLVTPEQHAQVWRELADLLSGGAA